MFFMEKIIGGAPVNTLPGFIGFAFLVFGLFLLLTGFQIINVEKVSVTPGKRTWGLGIVFAILGIVLLLPETKEQILGENEEVPSMPYLTNTPFSTNTPFPISTPTPYPTNTPYPTFTPIPTSVPEHILFEDNFDDGNLNGWTIKSGSWDVVDGQLRCIASHDARIIAGDGTWEDYSISADLASISGSVDVGILGRLLNEAHNYQGQLWNEKARIKVWDEDWSDITAESFPATNDIWYNLRLEFRGTNVKLYINNLLAAIAEDTMYQNGKIGLRCASNSQAYFDNVVVTRLSEGAVAPGE